MAMALHYDIMNAPVELRDRNWSNGRDSPKMHRHEMHRSDYRQPTSRHDFNRKKGADKIYNRPKMSIANKPRVIINISGKRYETYERTFKAKPNCLLAKQIRGTYFDKETGEYFFDRNAKVFESLLTYLQSGILVKPEGIADKVYLDDLRFFGFNNEAVNFYKSLLATTENVVKDMPKNCLQRKLWTVMEYPNSSCLAKAIAVVSTFIITLSIVIFCIETLPQFNEKNAETANSDLSIMARKLFMWIESGCVGWFTLEYVLRYIGTPQKIGFLYQPMNIIDLAAIVPFYVILAMQKTGSSLTSLAILRVLRLARVFRIFKLSRYSKALQLLMQTIYASVKELVLLLFLLAVLTVLFSSAFYHFETDGNRDSEFKSIPHTFWLSIVTITTVGYGDLVPITVGRCYCMSMRQHIM